MDLLFKKYADPFSLIRLYIENGRFCEFVYEFLRLEQKRKKEKEEKEELDKLWQAYVHSYSDEPFESWRKKIVTKREVGETVTREKIVNNPKIKRLLKRLN